MSPLNTNIIWIIVAREMLRDSTELIIASLEIYGAEVVEEFGDIITKDHLATANHNDWSHILEAVDEDWHKDPNFLAAALHQYDPNTRYCDTFKLQYNYEDFLESSFQ